jgi:iron complex transport system substrate-binding protein
MARWRLSLAALTLLACSQAVAWAAPLQVQDDRGKTVVLPAVPQRIVSLLPSLTEMVCALDACARLVGVDRYSNHPAAVRALPQVGGGIDPQLEAVVALRPDLVLAAQSTRGVERLEALGLKVLALEPRTAADIQRVLGVLGPVLGAADAQQVWRRIDAGVEAARQSLPEAARRQRVYFEASAGPYAAGPGSFIGEMLTRLGVGNVIDPSLGTFPKINPEMVVRANPDVIMVSERNAQGLTDRPGWAGIKAVREQRVCRFTADEADVLVRPGPRMADAARLMVRCLQTPTPNPPPRR